MWGLAGWRKDVEEEAVLALLRWRVGEDCSSEISPFGWVVELLDAGLAALLDGLREEPSGWLDGLLEALWRGGIWDAEELVYGCGGGWKDGSGTDDTAGVDRDGWVSGALFIRSGESTEGEEEGGKRP